MRDSGACFFQGREVEAGEVDVGAAVLGALAGVGPDEDDVFALHGDLHLGGVAWGFGDAFVGDHLGQGFVDLGDVDFGVAVAGVDPGDDPAAAAVGGDGDVGASLIGPLPFLRVITVTPF